MRWISERIFYFPACIYPGSTGSAVSRGPQKSTNISCAYEKTLAFLRSMKLVNIFPSAVYNSIVLLQRWINYHI